MQPDGQITDLLSHAKTHDEIADSYLAVIASHRARIRTTRARNDGVAVEN
jgi:hypothetical protein